MAQNNSRIELKNTAKDTVVTSIYITNGTYAANSMRDGDNIAKKFGGASGNDADWFMLTIKGFTGGALTTDSVNFYLADYRFADNTQDYIVKNWQWVDLSSLGAVDSVSFSLSSSDTGAWGMNTPAFFALDNFNDQTVTVNDIQNELSFFIYPNPAKNNVTVNTKSAIELLQVIDVTGKIRIEKTNLFKGVNNINLSLLNAGAYFVKTITKQGSSVQRLIKQ